MLTENNESLFKKELEDSVELLRYKWLRKNNEEKLMLLYSLYIPELNGKYLVIIETKYKHKASVINRVVKTEHLLLSNLLEDIKLLDSKKEESDKDIMIMINKFNRIVK